MLRAVWWATAAVGPPCVPRVALASLLGAHSLPQDRNLIREDTGGGHLSEGLGSSKLSLFGQDRGWQAYSPPCFCLQKKKKSENKNKYEDYTTETVWMWPAKLEILPVGPFTASACAPSTWMGCEWRESGLSGQSAGVCGAFGWLSPVVCVHTSALSRSNPCGSTFSAPGCRKTPQLLSRGVK